MNRLQRALPSLLLGILLLAIPVPVRAGEEEAAVRLKTVVIDPGHGGRDAGCVSRDRKTYEKNLTLAISKKLAEGIREKYPEVRVILTRSTDKFVELEGRAKIANNAKADLFISVHINAQDGGTKANGYSIHCLGQSSRKGNDLFSKNFDLCKRENSVIRLEKDYTTQYEGFDPTDDESYIFFSLIQNSNLERSLQFAEDVNVAMKGGSLRNSRGVSQDPFWVLWRTTMPAVLIECGFISNPADLEVLRSEKGIDNIAGNILNAFITYKTRYDMGARTEETKPAPEETELLKEEPAQAETKAAPVASDGVLYGTQVLATGKTMAEDDPFFAGYAPFLLKGEKLNRYFLGISTDRKEAEKKYQEIRKKFPDCFFAEIKDGKSTRAR